MVRPEQTEGPFFVEEHLNRVDIRTDPADGSVKPGIPLRLALRVTRVASGGCAPMPGVIVDLWHCDATGIYSDAAENGTLGKKFLRGSQVTDANGIAQFTTIYPGWYQGRAVHIHFKLGAANAGKTYDFTSQLYFDDSLSDSVFAESPYAVRGRARMRNSEDRIYRQGGRDLMLALTKSGDGYAGTFDVGLQLA